MENKQETKSVTLSFKATPSETIALQQIANEKNIKRAELLASLVSGYKHYYDYIGKPSPKEAQLQSELEKLKKQNRKLNLALENADTRIDMDMKARRKLMDENLKLNKALFNLREDHKTALSEIKGLKEIANVNQPVEDDATDSLLLFGSLGSMVLTGLTLIFMPAILRK